MAKDIEVNYQRTDPETGEKIPGTVTMTVPETVEEAVQMWGEDVVLQHAIASVKIAAQRICRSCDNAEEAQQAINNWTPGVPRAKEGGPSIRAITAKLRELPPEKRKEILAQIGVELD